MKLVTRHELSQRSDSELAALFHEVSRELAHTAAGSPERRDALATLENVQRERASRASCDPP